MRDAQELNNLVKKRAIDDLNDYPAASPIAALQLALSIIQRQDGVLRQTSPVWSASFSPDGRWLATTSDQDGFRLWDPKAKNQELIKLHQAQKVWSFSFSPNGERLATTSEENIIKLWKRQSDKLQPFVLIEKDYFIKAKVDKKEIGRIASISFSPDGKQLATVLRSGIVHLWNLQDAKKVATFQINERDEQVKILSVSFAAGNQLLATGSTDGTVQLWDLRGNQIKTFKAHEEAVQSISFDLNGKILATGSANGTINLWDWQNSLEEPTAELEGHEEAVQSISFSPDGKRLVTASSIALLVFGVSGAIN